ncbi:hypothetical protein [Ellagibacter sp.]|uniref:hypothetical protein n=1 Tax=Ellagibacter sp. TaxID=2137578 RepID=UPI003AB23846
MTHNISEAVLASSRIVMFSAAPGKILTRWEVPSDFPRDPANPPYQALCAEKWGNAKKRAELESAEIVRIANEYVKAGVNHLTLRTTEFYDLDKLCFHVRTIRENVPGLYEMSVNTGELDAQAAQKLYFAGASSAYHVLRLHEGTDTPFDPRGAQSHHQSHRRVAA